MNMSATVSTDSMVEVSKEEFFSIINGPVDIHPHNHSPDHTDWETRNRGFVGRSFPGWKNPSGEKRYYLTTTAHAVMVNKRKES